jgi:hypothetical protein
VLPHGATAQQLVTDDAAIVDYRACQLEGWHGETSSFLLPACTFLPGLEFTTGIGLVDDHGAGRETEWLLEAKYLFRPLEAGNWGVGAGPIHRIGRDPVEGVYAFVPLSYSLADDRLGLHANAGWIFEREHGHAHAHTGDGSHHLTWGFRADVEVNPWVAVVGEISGEDRLLPEYQISVRGTLVPDRLTLKLTRGGHTQDDMDGPGWTLGAAWTPPPFIRGERR